VCVLTFGRKRKLSRPPIAAHGFITGLSVSGRPIRRRAGGGVDRVPIRPENRARYPADWQQVRERIGARSGWRCECTGECGRGTHTDRCSNVHRGRAYGTGSLVILTVAHLDHTPENCADDNLRHMCQGCHLHYDKAHHAETKRARLAQRRPPA
jgi:hypothetical protein